ncbi:hypothetical protein B0F90DRAFT_1775322, partial [Multifurca ochricompacta]
CYAQRSVLCGVHGSARVHYLSHEPSTIRLDSGHCLASGLVKVWCYNQAQRETG